MKVNEDLAVLDVNSGAVHLLDQAAYDILGIFNGNNDEETVAALKDFYEETELNFCDRTGFEIPVPACSP